jgi:NAD(P)-dependent dehydrogenase (short-subunit alcohol dehydrogenase family)
MPDFHVLMSALTFLNINIVMVGGTQGIGAGIAVHFTELGASVLVVGCNEKLASDLIKTLETASQQNGWNISEVKLGFAWRDLGDVVEIKVVVDDISIWAGDRGVRYLVQSQGESLLLLIHWNFW